MHGTRFEDPTLERASRHERLENHPDRIAKPHPIHFDSLDSRPKVRWRFPLSGVTTLCCSRIELFERALSSNDLALGDDELNAKQIRGGLGLTSQAVQCPVSSF